jgi:amino acid adenylation domain-containing protein
VTAESVRLSEAKRRLLRKYLDGAVQRSPAERAPIGARHPAGPIPLSYEQEHIWLHCQLADDLPLYNEVLTVRRSGPLDVSALERSLGEIIRRHEAWRTIFVTADERPVQIVLPPPTISLPVVDLRGVPEAEREREACRLVAVEAQRPFDLARGPLLRAQLVRLAEAEHRLYLTLHQIIFDGVSVYSVFLPELLALYDAFAAGEASPLPEPAIQYADFACWERQRLRGDALAAQVDYWRRHLADAPAALELPADRARPKVQTFRGRQIAFTLPESLSEKLKTLSRQEGATLFMTLLAAFTLLLHRYTGQEDILVGTAISSRKWPEVERLLGVFLNTVILRTRLSGELRFRELLARVREVTLEGLAHGDVPFPLLIKELQPRRDPGRNPLFQATFVLEPPMPAPAAGWELTQMDVDTGMARVDLYLQLDDRPRGLVGHIRYNSALWDAPAMTRFAEHLHVLLEGIAANPDLPLSALPLLTSGERLGAAGRPGSAVRPANPFITFEPEEVEQSIPRRFEQQVARGPERVAVQSERGTWTYAALNQAANRVAHALGGADVDGARVALLLDQDAPMLAGILGVLKAGGAYVPLDPTHPGERLAHILGDALVSALLTSKRNLALAAGLAGGGMRIFVIEDLLGRPDAAEFGSPASPDHVAYILYTSGSTGQPKGVVQNHRNVLHFIRAYTNNLRICSEDRLTLIPSYSVDAAVMDIFGALLNGATLCPMDIRDVGLRGLCERLTEERISIYHSTPTLYRHFVQALADGPAVPAVRLVVLGGEEVRREDVESYRSRFAPHCLFVNGFGPTESTVSLQYFVDKSAVVDRRSVPIGSPVAETGVLLLSRDGRPAQVYGEIAIRSPYLALGYWRRPDLTRAAFLPDPAGGADRIYRTGDMGRLLPDGSIEFCGRRDRQVKIQGFRVELAEIEAALTQHPAVREAAATVCETEDGAQRVNVHWVAAGDPGPAPAALRAFLRERLPAHMIPSALLRVDALPLTPSGKLDRTALLALCEAEQPGREGAVGPRTPLEAQLVRIWEDLLKVRPVGIRDDFFALGGHSLLAARMVDAVERTMGRRLPLTTLLAGATVEDLARALAERESQPAPCRFTLLHPGGRRLPFFFLHGDRQGGGAYCASLARYVGPDRPFYALHPHGLDGGAVPVTIEAMAEDHLSTLRAARARGPYLLGGYCNGALVAFEMARRLVAAGEQVDLLALLDPPPATRRLRLLERVVDGAGHLQGLDAGRRLDRVVRTRQRALWLERRLWPTWAYLKDPSRYGAIGSLGRRKLARAATRLAERWRRGEADGEGPAPGPSAQLDAVYHRAVVRYVPPSYPGRVTLLLSLDSWMGARGWPRVARRLRRQVIPGNHANCITEHARAVGARLSACLAEAEDLDRADAERA